MSKSIEGEVLDETEKKIEKETKIGNREWEEIEKKGISSSCFHDMENEFSTRIVHYGPGKIQRWKIN